MRKFKVWVFKTQNSALKTCFYRTILPLTLRLGDPDCPATEAEVIEVQEISLTTTLLRLKNRLTFSKCLVPICPWLDSDKILFELYEFPEHHAIVPYHQPKCKEVISSTVSPDLGCSFQKYKENCTAIAHEPLVGFRNESNLLIPYLIGFPTSEGHCGEGSYATRTSYFEKFTSIVEKLMKK